MSSLNKNKIEFDKKEFIQRLYKWDSLIKLMLKTNDGSAIKK